MSEIKSVDQHITAELSKFSVTDAAIAQMETQYLPLTVDGLADMAGYAAVRAARICVKGHRVEVEKTRKLLKEDSLKFGRAVDAEAKRITAKLEVIESHLEGQEAIVENEKKRMAQVAEQARQERIKARVARLESLGMNFIGGGWFLGPLAIFNTQVETITDDEFGEFLISFEAESNARKAQAAREEAARVEKAAEAAAEAERLDTERKRLAEIEWKQNQQAEALRAEQDRLDAEKRAREEAQAREAAEKIRLAELEQAKKEAQERGRIEAEQKAKREAEAKVKAEHEAAAEAKRQEALKPDKEKLLTFAAEISSQISRLKSASIPRNSAIFDITDTVSVMLQDVVDFLKKEAGAL